VADVVDALIRILNEPLAQGDVFNVGSSEEISIEELARQIVSKTESASLIVHIPYDIAYETGFEDMARRVPDTTKLETLTGWRATRSLDQILDDVISETRKETAAFAAAGDAREAQ
jgi:UDP-glucose 4-epimerase